MKPHLSHVIESNLLHVNCSNIPTRGRQNKFIPSSQDLLTHQNEIKAENVMSCYVDRE